MRRGHSLAYIGIAQTGVNRMKSVLRPLVTGLVVVLGLCSVPAVAQQPSVVLGIRSVDSLLDDAEFVGEKAGQPGVREQAEGLIQGLTQGKGLAGLDRTKPLGAWSDIGEDGPKPGPVIFLPVSDSDAFLELLKTFAPDLEENDGVLTMTLNGQTIEGRIHDDYFFASPQPGALEELYVPAEIINEDYDVAIDVNIADIPEPLKAQFLAITESQGRMNLENGPQPASEAEAAGREFGFEAALAIMKGLVNDGESITIGVDIDSETGLASVDLGFVAKEGTELAASMQSFGELKPAFAAAVPEDSPFAIVISHPTAGILPQLESVFEQIGKAAEAEIDEDASLPSDEARQVARDAANQFLEIIKATASSGELHSAMFLDEGENNTISMTGATHLATTENIPGLLEKLAEDTNTDDEKVIQLNVQKYKGANIHAIEPKTAESVEMFGDGPAHLAVAKNVVVAGLGIDSLEAIKAFLDDSGTVAEEGVSPIYVRLNPARLVLMFEKNDEGLRERAAALIESEGDFVLMEVIPEDNGATFHTEFGLDLIRLANNNNR